VARKKRIKFKAPYSAAGSRYDTGDVAMVDHRLARSLCHAGHASITGDEVTGSSVRGKHKRPHGGGRVGKTARAQRVAIETQDARVDETKATTPADTPAATEGDMVATAGDLVKMRAKVAGMSRHKLRGLCKMMGLSQTGNKEALVAKLQQHIDDQLAGGE
jgi:hypothetical protein